jgi:ABC-type sugar transport system, periplasmic component
MRTGFFGFLAPVLLAVVLASCRESPAPTPPMRTIRVWFQTSSEAEQRALQSIADSFNVAHQHRGLRVAVEWFSSDTFAPQLAAAFARAAPPDAFSLDGSLVTRYAQAGLITPLDPWFDRNELEDFLPTVREQGTVAGRLYAIASLEAAAALYYDREMLARADVVPPPEGRAWTWSQFIAACERLKQAGVPPVALHLDASDNAVFQSFAPVIWSGGGELVGSDGRRVRGIFAAPENIASLAAWQTLFKNDYALAAPSDSDPFAEGIVAMDWNNHLAARTHLRRKGDTLGAMLLPRLGSRSIAPCGSWAWAISKRARDPETAALWVKWVTDLRHGIEPLVRATGGIPARRSAFGLFPEYARPPYRLFRDQLELAGRPRPQTPHFHLIAEGFADVLRDIARGQPVAPRLRSGEQHLADAIAREPAVLTPAE